MLAQDDWEVTSGSESPGPSEGEDGEAEEELAPDVD